MWKLSKKMLEYVFKFCFWLANNRKFKILNDIEAFTNNYEYFSILRPIILRGQSSWKLGFINVFSINKRTEAIFAGNSTSFPANSCQHICTRNSILLFQIKTISDSRHFRHVVLFPARNSHPHFWFVCIKQKSINCN